MNDCDLTCDTFGCTCEPPPGARSEPAHFAPSLIGWVLLAVIVIGTILGHLSDRS